MTVRATAKDGRQTDEIGAVPIKGLQGENLANALMKAVTKAKRRAILSVCGLGLLDETEVDSIPGARSGSAPTAAGDPPTLHPPTVEEVEAARVGAGKGDEPPTRTPETGGAASGTPAPSGFALEPELDPAATMTEAEWKAVKAAAAKRHITSAALRMWLKDGGFPINAPTELPAVCLTALRLRAAGKLEEANAALDRAKADLIPF